MSNLGNWFYPKLNQICKELGMKPEDVLVIMCSESGLNPSSFDKKHRGGGLIGFMPSTLKQLDYSGTPEEFKDTTGEEQLDYVKKVIQKIMNINGGPLKSATQYYIGNFIPIALRLPGIRANEPKTPFLEKNPEAVDKTGKPVEYDLDELFSTNNKKILSKKYFDVGISFPVLNESLSYTTNILFHGNTKDAITFEDMSKRVDKTKSEQIYRDALKDMNIAMKYIPMKNMVESVKNISSGNSFNSITKQAKTGVARLGSGFYPKLIQMCREVGIKPEDLLVVMCSESGLNNSAHEQKYNGGGLIGFMPSTLKQIGYKGSPEDFREMTGEDQLEYVKKVIQMIVGMNGGPIPSAATYYTGNFIPIALKLPGVRAGNLDAVFLEKHPEGVDKNGKPVEYNIDDLKKRWDKSILSKKYYDIGINFPVLNESLAYTGNWLFHGSAKDAITYGAMAKQADRVKTYGTYRKALKDMQAATSYVASPEATRVNKDLIDDDKHDEIKKHLDKIKNNPNAIFEKSDEEKIREALEKIKKNPNAVFDDDLKNDLKLNNPESQSKIEDAIDKIKANHSDVFNNAKPTDTKPSELKYNGKVEDVVDNIMKSNSLISSACINFENKYASFVKNAFIRKMPSGKYRVVSHKGRNLGEYKTKQEAKKRLQQVEFFKHQADDGKFKQIDLTKIKNLSLSSVMREINKVDKDKALEFLKCFNENFNKSVFDELQSPEKVSLQKALVEFGKENDLKINLTKNAAISELGTAELVAAYLSSMIQFLMKRISPMTRPKSLQSLKTKIYYMNEVDLQNKKMPASSAIGQSITLVKHVLMNHDQTYIRQVLNELTRLL